MTWVRLNVGGEMIETSLATVTKYPDSNLAKMFLSAQEKTSNEDMETADTPARSGGPNLEVADTGLFSEVSVERTAVQRRRSRI